MVFENNKERRAKGREKPDYYQVRWMAPGRKFRKKNFTLKRDADNHAASVEHTKITGSYIDPSAGRISFKEYAESWRAIQVHRPGTADQVETRLRRHVYPRIGHRPMGAVRRNEIQSLVKWMSSGDEDNAPLAPATIKVAFDWVAIIFKAAVTNRDISVSPCHGIKLPGVDQSEIKVLPVETVAALTDAMPERYRSLIVLGAGSGVRIAEALAVTADRIDWPRQTLKVDRQLLRVSADTPVFGPVKDKKNRPRTIPLSDEVMAALVEHVRIFGTGPEDLVFTGDDGGPVRRSTFSDVWGRAARPLGIPLGDGFHQLRHFYASVLIHGGADIVLVQKMLGHASLTTTQIYAHLFPNSDDMVRTAVDRAMRSLRKDPAESSSENLLSSSGPVAPSDS
jgi:integrase